MNTKSRSSFRLFIIPLIAALLLAAAISISDRYNSSRFPELGSTEAPASPYRPVSASDMSLTVSGTDGGLTVTIIPVTPSDLPPSAADAVTEESVSIPIDNDPVSPALPEDAAEHTAAVAKKGNAEHVVDPDYESDYYIVVYTGSQNVLIYGKGSDGKYNDVVKCFVCSSGKSGHSTRLGQYSIIRRYRWRLLVGDVYGQYSTGFSPSYLFHSVPYLEEDDPSSLDMAEYDKLGQPASKGCIRLCVRDAKWIYDNCPDGTQINIVDDSNDTPGEQILPRIDDKKFAGWDPSDPDPDNPYNTEAVG